MKHDTWIEPHSRWFDPDLKTPTNGRLCYECETELGGAVFCERVDGEWINIDSNSKPSKVIRWRVVAMESLLQDKRQWVLTGVMVLKKMPRTK